MSRNGGETSWCTAFATTTFPPVDSRGPAAAGELNPATADSVSAAINDPTTGSLLMGPSCLRGAPGPTEAMPGRREGQVGCPADGFPRKWPPAATEGYAEGPRKRRNLQRLPRS